VDANFDAARSVVTTSVLECYAQDMDSGKEWGLFPWLTDRTFIHRETDTSQFAVTTSE